VVTDAEAVAGLAGQLGYPASTDAMEDRIRSITGRDDRAIYVACQKWVVVGWIDVSIVNHLQVEPYAEIGGLVVSDQCRSSGIGKRLVEEAEQWARARGLRLMVVRSRIQREAAHRFYLREGYERTKTSAVFSKLIG